MQAQKDDRKQFDCPKRVRDALDFLGLTLKEAKFTLLNYQKIQMSTPVASSDNVVEIANEVRAWKTVRVHLKSQSYRRRIEINLANYMRRVDSLNQLLRAVSDCEIKHDEAPRLSQTLQHIIDTMELQQFFFIHPWKSLPENTIRALKRKANLIQNEVAAIWDFEATFRGLLRRCRLKSPNKIVPVYPYPDYILSEAIKEWQCEWAWIAIPATIR